MTARNGSDRRRLVPQEVGTVLKDRVEIRLQSLGVCVIVRVAGELGVSTAPVLRDQLLGQLALGQRRLVVDLHRIDFIDSTGLSAVLAAHQEAATGGGSVRLVGRRSVRRIVEACGLNRVLPVHDDVSEALEATMEDAGRRGGSDTPAH
ncbi:MAG: STAS domain-containing protein [Jiangellaceae bacterium]